MRKLSLNKETLAELTDVELGAVAGGAITPNCPNNTLTCAGGCNSDFQQCITGVRCLSVTGC
ncbi:MAG TPA: class I lanthipeptide [Frankiaceae bacterium]|jgi:hypothetical protein|nr:class I lanthipeptide [Frankiaceae bacterium]